MLDFDYHEVKIAQAIIAHSRQVFLAADHTKFGRNAMVNLGNLSQIHAPVHGSGAAGEADATDVPASDRLPHLLSSPAQASGRPGGAFSLPLPGPRGPQGA